MLLKIILIKLFNVIVCVVLGIKNLYDFNCGLKVYCCDVVKNIEVYGEMYCYIFYLVKNVGFFKIVEKVVYY